MKIRIKRYISQLFFLIFANLGFRINNLFNGKTGFCYPFFYCHSCPTAASACPIRAIEEGLHKTGFKPNSIKWTYIIYPLTIIGIVGTLTGRAVCGWACPIGLLQRITGKIARRFKKYKIIKTLGNSKIEPYFRYIKYFILIGFIFLTVAIIGFMFTNICPVGFLVGTIPILILNPGAYIPTVFFYPALVIFILFLVLIFTVERGWCRYFCPVGALLAPFNKISLYHVSVDKKNCTNCNLCSRVCPMGIDVPNMKRDPECILCGKCVEACPNKFITFERGGFSK